MQNLCAVVQIYADFRPTYERDRQSRLGLSLSHVIALSYLEQMITTPSVVLFYPTIRLLSVFRGRGS